MRERKSKVRKPATGAPAAAGEVKSIGKIPGDPAPGTVMNPGLEQARQQRYSNLCAMIGDRNFRVAKLNAEIGVLYQQIEQLPNWKPETPSQA